MINSSCFFGALCTHEMVGVVLAGLARGGEYTSWVAILAPGSFYLPNWRTKRHLLFGWSVNGGTILKATLQSFGKVFQEDTWHLTFPNDGGR